MFPFILTKNRTFVTLVTLIAFINIAARPCTKTDSTTIITANQN